MTDSPRLPPGSTPLDGLGSDASLRFLGAVSTVTGSRYLIEAGSAVVLLDAGLYQGPSDLRRRNWEPFPVPPRSIDAVVLTHAHVDHCGYLPVLVRDGFTGPVLCTPGTAALTRIVLPDSGRLHEEEARHANRHGWSKHRPARPLFTEEDAAAVLPLLREVPFGEPVPLDGADGDALVASFAPAGHILGAATVTMDLVRSGRRLVASGDLGRPVHPLLHPPAPRPECDTLLIESTYGDREHEGNGVERIAERIVATAERGGTVVIPSFAVDRTEIVLYTLRQLEAAGAIPELPVIVDSPMALAALAVYRRAIAERWPELRPDLDAGGDPFSVRSLAEARSVEESKDATARNDPAIVISAAGMATGGRVLHHLVRRLPDRRSLVLLPGYQVPGTRGHQLLSGATELKIHGRYVPVRAEVIAVDAFSAHAGAAELVSWAETCPSAPETAFVVHGEAHASIALRDRLHGAGWTAVVPRLGERIAL